MSDLSNLLNLVVAAFGIVAGIYGAYKVISGGFASHPNTKPLDVFAGTNELRDRLLRLKGRTVNFDTVLDFSIGDELSSRIAEETEYRKLLGRDAKNLNGKRLPLYVVTEHGALDSFASLVVEMKDGGRLKFSHGGTGVIQIPLKGRFDIEVRAYSGESAEITLREV